MCLSKHLATTKNWPSISQNVEELGFSGYKEGRADRSCDGETKVRRSHQNSGVIYTSELPLRHRIARNAKIDFKMKKLIVRQNICENNGNGC